MLQTLIVVGVAGFALGASAAGIISVTAYNSDTHPFNGGIGTFSTGNSLTVARNSTTIYPPDPYIVPLLGPSAAGALVYSFSDRNHVWTGYGTGIGSAPNPATFPSYLRGIDYIMTMNGNRDNVPTTNTPSGFRMDVITSGPGTAYLFVDNRIGDGNALNEPTLSSPFVQWIISDGWTLVATGLIPADYLGSNDILGIDESNDGTINQYLSVYSRPISGNSFSIYSFSGEGLNMYGAAFALIPEPSTLALGGLGVALACYLRRRR